MMILVLAFVAGLAQEPVACRIGPLPASAATAEAVPECPQGTTNPKVVREKRPKYNRDAMRARVQGKVEMDVVVRADGKVGPVRVVKSLQPDLDEAAVASVREWEFEPATRNGTRVPVLVRIEMTFSLR